MKSMVGLWYVCLMEAGNQYSVHTRRDADYASQRIRTEGSSFLTITLPAYEKDLLTAVSREQITSDLFPAFRKRGGLPAFLSGFLRLMFDESGKLRPDAPSDVLKSVRQVLLLLSKVELETTQDRKDSAIAKYLATDEGIESISDELKREFIKTVRRDLDGYFSEIEARIFRSDWRPRHSSGALASRESFNSRFGFRVWTERLQDIFPWEYDMDLTIRQLRELDISILSRDQEVPSKVALVPKTMKTPRVIAEEPVWNQFVQQGILNVMTDSLLLPRFKYLYDTFGWIDQEPNRTLAKEGSIDGSLSTIDLSEASDRVSLELVETLLSDHQYLLRALKACRSERCKLPDGRVISLRKFASMGSSTCFPIESMIFYAICRMAYRRHGLLDSKLRVYGDDLIVDTRVAQSVIGLLEAMGLKVNSGKSFTTGLFRESCGSDWFKGENVRAFKLGHPLPDNPHQYSLIRKGIEFHNSAYEAGWFSLAEYTLRQLRKVIPYVLFTEPGSTILAFYSWTEKPRLRVNPNLQKLEVRGYRFRETKPLDPIDGEFALRKCLNPHPERNVEHLQRDGRSQCVGMNIGWLALH